MTGKRLIYFIVAAFIAGNLILIIIKYNSDKNIEKLVDDNEKLLIEFEVSNQLGALERGVVLVDSKIRGTIATNDTAFIEGVEMQMANIQDDLNKLQNLWGDDSVEINLGLLDSLVREKLRLNDQILKVYAREGQKAPAARIAQQRGKKLTDSILSLTQQITSIRQNRMIHVSRAIDESVNQVQRLDTYLILFILVSGAALFWYIINTLRTQSRLIKQVRHSEKKVKEIARVKENFLANMSHEIRTPLNAILGFTNLLQLKKLDHESGVYVQSIQRSGENLLTIINDILDLSKIEAGMMRIERSPFSLRGLVHSIENMFLPSANEKRIDFFARIDESLPDILDGDATRLTQILMNLIGNAMKFTTRGKVFISFENKGNDGTMVLLGIEVSDTGIGIPKEKLEKIFDRFQQADDAVTREYGGTGLGLSIVKELVELQQGTIRVESDTGNGTTFYLVIPYKKSDEQFITHPTFIRQPDTNPATLQNVRILIVEDNEVNQTLLRYLFQKWQVKFEMANNGIEAIEKLKRETYDLILMDIQMPQMDGYTATRQIRNILKIKTPIIAMTAHAMAGEREKCLSYGMAEYISKPIREEQLIRLITQFVSIDTSSSTNQLGTTGSIETQYTYINLAYLHEVSAGNKDYEKDVTTQFILAVPDEVAALNRAVEVNDKEGLRRITHNLRTSVSVMGLNELLEPYFDSIEYGVAEENNLAESIENIKRICSHAMPEAKKYLASISG
ncbi:MAG TPA: ATP-binding protein [Flavitalea sp.]|nr:ATP-binding protein [Flavitalea sp.]